VPDYGDIYVGLPLDWQPDPAWVPPPHWGYEVPGAVPAAPELAPVPAVAPPLEVAAPPAEQALPPESELAAVPLPIDDALAGAPPTPPPLPPIEPDAITGADLAPPAPIDPEQLDTAAMPVTLADQWARDPLHSPVAGQAKQYAETASTAALLDQQRQIDTARQTKLLLDQARADEENLRQTKLNLDARRAADAETSKKMDQIAADAQNLAKVDPNRLMSRMSGGQTFVQLLTLALGGLLAGKTGGPNIALDMFQRRLDNDIDAQKAEIENGKYRIGLRQNAVAQEYARTGNLFQAAETVRAATYQAAINKMQTEQQNFDPAGTAYVRYGQQLKEMQGRQASALEAARQRDFDENYKTNTQKLQQQQQDETARQHRAQLGLGYAQLDSAAADRKLARDLKAAEKKAEKADKEAELDRQFTVSTPRPALAIDDKGKPVIGPDGNPVVLTQQFTNKNGKPWRLGSSEQTAAMKAKIVAASEITDMIDEVLDIRDKVGGELLPWSDAKQRLDLLQERMRLVRKSGTQGMSSDKDFEALGASIGAKDLTAFIDQSPGLKKARELTTRELNTEMRTNNYDGPAISFANKYSDATNTPEDEKRKSLLKKPDVTLDEAIRANLQKVTGARGYEIDINDPADQEIYRRVVDETRASFSSGATSVQAEDIAAYGRAAAGGDPAARDVLQEVAAKGQTARLRDLAKAQIEALTPKPAPRGPVSEPLTIPDELRLP
jgi:hypothetical protein